MTVDEEYYDGAPKRLTPEELDKQIARLTAPPRPVEVRDPFPVCPTVHISQADLDRMTERLYTESLQRKAAQQQELEKRLYPTAQTATGGTLSEERLQGSVDRLYTQSVERKSRKLAETKQRYEAPPPKVPKVPIKDYVQHMYYDRMEKKKKTEEKLYEKYIVPTEVRTGKIPRSQLVESVDRLSTKH